MFEGMALLAPVFIRNRSLRQLQLNGNNIGDEGAELLFEAIKERNVLQSIELSRCGLCECRWARHLRSTSSLSSISVSNNLIDPIGLDRLCDGILGCASLRNVDMSHNLFGSGHCLLLARVVGNNQGLYSLNLSGNGFSDDAVNNIFAALPQNPYLVSIDLRLGGLDANRLKKLHNMVSAVEGVKVRKYR